MFSTEGQIFLDRVSQLSVEYPLGDNPFLLLLSPKGRYSPDLRRSVAVGSEGRNGVWLESLG